MSSSALTDLAARLAEDTLDIMDRTGDDRLFFEVAKVLGSSSQTIEEAFITEIRARLAERQARDFLKAKVQDYKARTRDTAPEGGA